MSTYRLTTALMAAVLIATLISIGVSCSNPDSANPNPQRTAATGPFGGGGLGGGGGMELNGGGGGPESLPYPFNYDEEANWTIRNYSDPFFGTVSIIDDHILVGFKNYNPIPAADPNYFDPPVPVNNTFYEQCDYPSTRLYDLDIAAFIAAENLTPFTEWTPIAGAGFVLPEGQTVEDAVATWPIQYPNLIASVQPDVLGETCDCDDFPQEDPCDDRYGQEWAHIPSEAYTINSRAAWKVTGGLGDPTVEIAILDYGVDDSIVDLHVNSDTYGCNVGDSLASTEFKLRTQHGGEAWDWIKNLNGVHHANELGHGTACAGIACAKIANDDGPYGDDKDIAGVCNNNKFYSIALKAKDGQFSTSTIINAMVALACIKGTYVASKIYGPGVVCPKRNIEVASCSLGIKATGTGGVGNKALNDIGPYICFVGSAGNNGSNTYTVWPGNHALSCCVAAHDRFGLRGVWGNESSNYYNPGVDIAAPGSEITTSDMRGSNPYGQYFGYTQGVTNDDFKGTSAATPFVAGAAALVSGRYTSKSPAQVQARLKATHYTLPGQLNFCGEVDVLKALNDPWN